MPAILNWLLRLLLTNPICMRLVQGGSRRARHLYIRAGYLGVIGVVLVLALLGKQVLSVRDLAQSGAAMFERVSYLQVGLICLLTPVFMAGAIAQEANPKTWDILLTTPLNSMQVVLGNLFGRLFFVLALLFSSLPLFAITQYFGGVPGDSILSSYAIAGTSALIVAAIAVTLSVTRTAGRRAVFIFYITVIMYLFVTFALDLQFRSPQVLPGGGVSDVDQTTFLTPLNPFLALTVLLQSNQYVPHELNVGDAGWIRRMWLGRPIASFCWLCTLISLFLIVFSTLRLRVIGAKVGTIPWYRRLLKLGAADAKERPARSVSQNPISWREAFSRGRSILSIMARWGFVALGVLIALLLVWLFHTGRLNFDSLRLAVTSVLTAEVVIIALLAINMSATAVSREREDGSLDIILTTPIQPGPYLTGKLRGLVQYLLPMILVPTLTLAIIGVYVQANGFGVAGGVHSTDPNPHQAGTFPPMDVILPEGAIALPIMLVPFIAFCVMIGLGRSIKCKGTIGSVLGAVAIVLAVGGVLTGCGFPAAENMGILGSALVSMSPISQIFAIVQPTTTIDNGLDDGIRAARIALLIGAGVWAIIYTALVYALHTTMKRTFMFDVRKLAGTS